MGVVARVTHNTSHKNTDNHSHSITWHGTSHYTSPPPTAHITAPPHPTSHHHTSTHTIPAHMLPSHTHTHHSPPTSGPRPHHSPPTSGPRPHHSPPTSGPVHITAHPPQDPAHITAHPPQAPPTSGPRPHCTTDLGSLAQVANQLHKRVIASSKLLQHLFPWRNPASSFHGESFICVLHIPRAHIH